jgi:hypothetical protein
MNLLECQKRFAVATLARLMNGFPDEEPNPADYGVDYFSGVAVSLMVQKMFDEHVLAKARAMIPLLAHGETGNRTLGHVGDGPGLGVTYYGVGAVFHGGAPVLSDYFPD